MIKSKINRIELDKNFFNKRNVTSFVGLARNASNARLFAAREALSKDFEDSKVTQEIEGGSNNPESQSNISNTLGGKGNLFTFIGFDYGDNPVEELRDFINQNITQEERPEIVVGNRKVSYNFTTHYPSLEDIYEATPMPWNSDSWVRGIEKGISGLRNYIYWKYFEESRSTFGKQARNSLRDIEFSPVDYMKKIINNFKARFNK